MLILDKFRIWTRVFSSSTEYIGALSRIERTLKRKAYLPGCSPPFPYSPPSSILWVPPQVNKQTIASRELQEGKYWIIDARCHEVRLNLHCCGNTLSMSLWFSASSLRCSTSQDATGGVYFDQRFRECFCYVKEEWHIDFNVTFFSWELMNILKFEEWIRDLWSMCLE